MWVRKEEGGNGKLRYKKNLLRHETGSQRAQDRSFAGGRCMWLHVKCDHTSHASVIKLCGFHWEKQNKTKPNHKQKNFQEMLTYKI